MAKRGKEYQEIAAAVERALDPGATVQVGEWMIGPDGSRELDVTVGGSVQSVPAFILIECKDWNRPVGIETIDALESKARDLKADRTIIYSNSVFTSRALRKAKRSNIETLSALAEGKHIRVATTRELIADARSVDKYRLILSPAPGDATSNFGCEDLLHNNLPVLNWASLVSTQILQEHGDASEILASFLFRGEQMFTLCGVTIPLTELAIWMAISRKYLSQKVVADATLGHYDYARKRITFPNEQDFILGPIDMTKWQDAEPPRESIELETGELEISIELFNPIRPIDGVAAPVLDEIIAEKHIETR